MITRLDGLCHVEMAAVEDVDVYFEFRGVEVNVTGKRFVPGGFKLEHYYVWIGNDDLGEVELENFPLLWAYLEAMAMRQHKADHALR
jgi:hypothetical protein